MVKKSGISQKEVEWNRRNWTKEKAERVRANIDKQGIKRQFFAKEYMGMVPRTFNRKLKDGTWTDEELKLLKKHKLL